MKRRASVLALLFSSGLLLVSSSRCIVSQEGGVSLYDVTASTEAGRKFVQENHVQYICRDTWGVFFADLKRNDCHFGIVAPDQRHWTAVDPYRAAVFGLKPAFTWWDRFGCWIAIPVGFLLCIVGVAVVAWFIYGYW